MRRARYRRWTQPSLPLRPSTADPAQGPQTAFEEMTAGPWWIAGNLEISTAVLAVSQKGTWCSLAAIPAVKRFQGS